MKKMFIFVTIIIITGLFYYFYFKKEIKNEITFEKEKIEFGSLEQIVSFTGQLEAVKTVDVGTQVSGIISEIYADFNQKIKKDEILAVLDTTLLKISLNDAKLGLSKAEIAMIEAESNYKRTKQLFERNMISESDFIPVKVKYLQAQVNIETAKSVLAKSKINMDNAIIKSPIDGVIIQRNIEEGQTVAASLSAPTLFLIAEDLTKMQIMAKVDESDIGVIKKGQQVRFDVLAYPDEIFEGYIEQIRLNPVIEQNVVNYFVIISVINDKKLLLPGMTATIECIVEKNDDVYIVSNKALAYRPSKEIMEKYFSDNIENPQRRVRGNRQNNDRENRQRGQKRQENRGRLWYMADSINIKSFFIEKGMNDGQKTVITSNNKDIKDLEIIVSEKNSDEKRNVPEQRRVRRLF